MDDKKVNETEEVSRHEQLKFRLRNRVDKEIFDHMSEEIQDYLIAMDPADVKEAYLTTLLKLPWKSSFEVPKIELKLAKLMLDRSHYGMTDVKEKVLRYMACQKHLGKIMEQFCYWRVHRALERLRLLCQLQGLWDGRV